MTVALSREPSPAILWLLDANVISELARFHPDPQVERLFQQHQSELALPAPVWHELNYGLLRLPEGARKARLLAFLQRVCGTLPKLPYDEAAAMIHAQLRAESAARGRVLPFADAQIASVAIAQGCTLVTRNAKDFADVPGLRWVNWFSN